jgi:SAM-dependent methyltransferase
MDYLNSRLTAAYDSLNPPADYERFYLGLAGTEPEKILDMGCGTGRLACELARHGYRVTGVRSRGRSQAVFERGWLRLSNRYGDWDRSPVEHQSPELIVMAQP